MQITRLRNRSLELLLVVCLVSQAGCGERKRSVPGPSAPAQRVLPVNADALDYMSWIGALDLVIALPRTWREYGNVEPFELEKRGLPLLADFRAEAVLVLKPDLVLIDGTQSIETCRQLERAGIALFVLARFRDSQDLIDNMRRLAVRIGRVALVETKIKGLEREVRDLEELRTGLNGNAPSILPYFNYNTSVWTAGLGSAEDWMIRMAGGRNAASEYGISGNKELPIEFILKAPPDWFLSSQGEQVRLLKTHPRLKQLAAVREGRIIVMSRQLRANSSPYIVHAARQLALRLRQR